MYLHTFKTSSETFVRAGLLFTGEAKVHGKREFIDINDRLSTLLTKPEDKRTIVQRPHSNKECYKCLYPTGLSMKDPEKNY